MGFFEQGIPMGIPLIPDLGNSRSGVPLLYRGVFSDPPEGGLDLVTNRQGAGCHLVGVYSFFLSPPRGGTGFSY